MNFIRNWQDFINIDESDDVIAIFHDFLSITFIISRECVGNCDENAR